MNLFLHELAHIILSLLVGFIVWKKLHKRSSVIIVALLGGVFVDLDHLFDYFFAFGTKFNLTYFVKGYSFLKSDKIYIPLHSWEIVIFCLLLFFILTYFKNFMNFTNFINLITLKTILLVFSLSLFSHLAFDVISNELPISSYFFIKRANSNFKLKQLVYPKHYKKHLEEKKFKEFNLVNKEDHFLIIKNDIF